MIIYQKSILTNFSNKLDMDIFDNAVRTSSIGTNFAGLQRDVDLLSIMFIVALTNSEIVILNNLILAHVTLLTSQTNIDSTIIENVSCNINTSGNNSTVYKKIGVYLYIGSIYKNISKICAIAYTDKASSYSIRVYDVTNKKVICEGTFSNITSDLQNLGTITNLPKTKSIFEIQSKTNDKSSTTVFCELITITQ
jgi:hypothetical protein